MATIPKFLIYALCEPDGDQAIRYIGQSATGMTRPRRHSQPSYVKTTRTRSRNWVKSLLDRGVKPVIEVIEEFDSAKPLDEAEEFHIAYFRSLGFDLTNILESQITRRGWKPSPEHRGKLRQRNLGNTYGKGRRHSEEEKAARRAYRHTDENREKIRQAGIGRKISESGKERLRLANLGNKYSAGRKYTEEQKLGMSEKAKRRLAEKPMSQETRDKIATSLSGRILGPRPKDIVQKVIEKMKKPVVDDSGQWHESVQAASKHLGISEQSAIALLKGRKERVKGRSLQYASEVK